MLCRLCQRTWFTARHKGTVRTLTIKSLGAYISFLTNISGLLSKMNTYIVYCRANTIARLFYYYLLLLYIFVFRLGRCSTVKIGSKRDKLLLKTLIIPRVGLNKKFGSFFIYATIFPFSLTSGFATLTASLHLLFPVLPRLCRKAK